MSTPALTRTAALAFQASFFVRSSASRTRGGSAEAKADGAANGNGGTAAESASAAKAAAEREAQRVGVGIVCELLLDECLRRGSTDNVSAVLV